MPGGIVVEFDIVAAAAAVSAVAAATATATARLERNSWLYRCRNGVVGAGRRLERYESRQTETSSCALLGLQHAHTHNTNGQGNGKRERTCLA